jgi:PadR family transcriptional regulator
VKLPSRTDEFVLLAVWRLQDDAYGVKIREALMTMTSQDWSFGSIFVSLERLTDRELLASRMGESTPVRGGRAKRFYRLTTEGKAALLRVRALQKDAWEGVSEAALALLPGNSG